jgi:hypothetical protein
MILLPASIEGRRHSESGGLLMIKRSLVFALTVATALTASSLASAHDVRIIDVAYRHHHYQGNYGISREDAVDIARANGLAYVDSVRIVGRNYKVAGKNRNYNFRLFTIDRYDGTVIDIGHVRGQNY